MATESRVVRLSIEGVETVRHNVLIVRDGEHLSPRIAATVAAVRATSADLPHPASD